MIKVLALGHAWGTRGMPNQSLGDTQNPSGRDLLRTIWRWKWVVVLVVVVSTATAYAYSAAQAPQYRAAAQLMYEQPLNVSDPLSSAYVDPNVRELALESVQTVVTSPEVVSRAESALGALPAHPYQVSAQVVGPTTGAGYRSAVEISATGTDAAEAAAVANAYADAVMGWSRDQQLARVDQAKKATLARMQSLRAANSDGTADYTQLQLQLQNLQALAATVTGNFRVIVPATQPSAPIAPRPMSAAAFGFGIGLAAGLGLALVFGQFSTRVRGRREVARALDLPIVGVIPEVPRRSLNKWELISLTEPESGAAEALRLLRSNLDYVNVDHVTSILVTSSLTGEGKSTTVCNLAVTLAMAGKNVIIVDGDLREPRVHDYFGIDNDVGLSSVVAGSATLQGALKPVELPAPVRRGRGGNGSKPNPSLTASTIRRRRLVVLTAGPSPVDPGEMVASDRFGAVLAELQSGSVDLVIIDSPPILAVGDATAMAAQAAGLLLVVDIAKVRLPTLHQTKRSSLRRFPASSSEPCWSGPNPDMVATGTTATGARERSSPAQSSRTTVVLRAAWFCGR